MASPSGTRTHIARVLWIAPLLVGMSGCVAIKTTVELAQAEQALAEARNHDAQNLAVYEYTMAVRYLEKAREENGGADYRMSEKLAERSMEWADKAIIAIERGRRGIDTLEDDLSAMPTGEQALPEGEVDEDLLEELDMPEPEAPADEPFGDFEDLDEDFEMDQ